MGYERMAQVDGMGQFSIRGGIIDIFPLTEEVPLRIELWDDEVDSIRTFDTESQRSVEQLDFVTIYPAAEVVLDKNRLGQGRPVAKEAKTFEKALREQHKPEEAHRIHSIIEELTDGLREAGSWGAGRVYPVFLSGYSVLSGVFPQGGEAWCTWMNLLGSGRKGETVELEFREA